MEVYTVIWESDMYDGGYEFIGVYKTREKAFDKLIEYLNALVETHDIDSYEIKEKGFEINPKVRVIYNDYKISEAWCFTTNLE